MTSGAGRVLERSPTDRVCPVDLDPMDMDPMDMDPMDMDPMDTNTASSGASVPGTSSVGDDADQPDAVTEPTDKGGPTSADPTDSTTTSESSADDPEGQFSGDIEVEQLIAEHSDAVFRVAMSVTRDVTLAEDVTQDSLLKAWQALPSYRGEAPLRNWILRITHNTAVSALRRRREELRDPAELPEQVSHSSVELTVQNRLAFDRFNAALGELDDVSRAIVTLRELEGATYDEICEILELPLPTVKTRLLRARRQLARSLEGWRP